MRNSETPSPTGSTSPGFPRASRFESCLDAHPRLQVAQAVKPVAKDLGLANFDHQTNVAIGLHIVKCKCAASSAQRPELRHAGLNNVNREAELETPSRVACGDFLRRTCHT